jgi:hypothetical protein
MDDRCSICKGEERLLHSTPGITAIVCLECVHRADELVRRRIKSLRRRISPKHVDRLYAEAYSELLKKAARQI